MIRGYHVYKDVWQPQNGEVLQCRRERNIHDPYAVAVIKNGSVVGHVPRRLSTLCSLFLRHGCIDCRVTGNRRYSRDLPQGGLEIPCSLIFHGDPLKIEKVKQLIKELLQDDKGMEEEDDVLDIVEVKAVKKRKVNGEEEWVQVGPIVLTMADKEIVTKGHELNDLHINMCQMLIRNQFPAIAGLCSTLKVTTTSVECWVQNYVQIFHCRGNHWVTVSTLGCDTNEVMVYDSLYTDIDIATKCSIQEVFNTSSIKCVLPQVQKQQGAVDCGLYAMGFATYLAHGKNPRALTTLQFQQSKLRDHILVCFEQKFMKEFPVC